MANIYLEKLASVSIGLPLAHGPGAVKSSLGMPPNQKVPKQTIQALSQMKGVAGQKGAIGTQNLSKTDFKANK